MDPFYVEKVLTSSVRDKNSNINMFKNISLVTSVFFDGHSTLKCI